MKRNKAKFLEYNKNKGVRKLKNVPKRTCLGCNEIKPKRELIRIVKNKENQIFLDKTGKANGRGAYICNNITCLEKAIKAKRLERTFEIKISEEIYEELRESIEPRS